MPELAEVEVVRRNLVEWWEGRAASKVCLFDEKLLNETDTDALVQTLGEPLQEAGRRGKYLLCHFAGGQTVVFHFRMTGKIIGCDEPEPDYARLAWRVGDTWLVFKDQRRLGEARLFASADEFAAYEPLVKMGPEPEDVTVDYLREVCSDRRMLKTALLDQSIVAGVGNIAISELFWRLKLAPGVKCGELTDDDWQALVDEMPAYFDDVIEFSMSDEVWYIEEAGGGQRESPFRIYGRAGEACPRCGAELEKTRVGGRSSYFCGECQGGRG